MIQFVLGLIVGLIAGSVATIIIGNKPFELRIEFKEEPDP